MLKKSPWFLAANAFGLPDNILLQKRAGQKWPARFYQGCSQCINVLCFNAGFDRLSPNENRLTPNTYSLNPNTYPFTLSLSKGCLANFVSLLGSPGTRPHWRLFPLYFLHFFTQLLSDAVTLPLSVHFKA